MVRTPLLLLLLSLALAAVASTGCNSPYHSDRGALFGGLLGAGTGAAIGSMTGHAGAGAAIGAGVGALTGAAIGQGQDEIEANNRAMIAQQLGRQVSAGAVSVDDVISMSKAGVNEELIANHVRAHCMIVPLQTADLIRLKQEGVSERVIAQMQASPPKPVERVVVRESAPPPTVIIESDPYGPYWGPPPRHYGHAYYRWH